MAQVLNSRVSFPEDSLVHFLYDVSRFRRSEMNVSAHYARFPTADGFQRCYSVSKRKCMFIFGSPGRNRDRQ